MSAHTFAKLDRAYVKSVLLGMQQAIENGALIQWEPVIRLCHKVITNASVAVEGDLTSARRSDESDVKRHTLALLMTGLKSGPAEIPIALRTLTWETLRPLTQDSDPTPDYEAAQYGSNMDPATLSINTIRGEAMHRVIQYGMWVRRSFEKLADTSSATEGFGAMPELREVLDYHLNVSNESSLAIRAVYGQWVPWLLFLDNNWTRTNIDSIFPRDGSLADYRHVAWYTYIIYCPPYDEVFDILKQEYATATATIAAESIWKPAHINPDESLANHIMAFYWRGRLDLDRSGLCQDFFRRAPQKVAGYAIKFIGRSLKNTNEGISDRILDRLRDLWEQRLDIAKTDDVGLHFLELSAFGWWFTSGKFEQNWALRKLQEALEIAGYIDDDLHVVEELAKLSFNDPIRTIKCVNLLVKAPKDPGRIFAYQEAARRVIASAMTSDSKTARALAGATVQLLVAQGHMGFTDLLPSA